MTGSGLTRAEYQALLRRDFAGFAHRAFYELNARADFAVNWHVEVVAAKLAAVRAGHVRRLDRQSAAAPSQIAFGLGGVSRLVPRP